MSNANDKRSVATDALAVLGTILHDANQKRDAIHLAVEPVIASCYLKPGQTITVRNGKAYPIKRGEELGIVDPFLGEDVRQGERFLFIMNPRMVHSLRHVWTHPAFPDEVGTPAQSVDRKPESEAWLRAYAVRVNSHYEDDPEYAYKILMEGIKSGELVYHGTDMHSRGDLIDADELQYHASIVLGRQVKWDEFEYFSCTC